MNPFKWLFRKDITVARDSVTFIGERIPLERLTLTDAENAQMHAPKPPGRARFIEVMNQARGYYGESCFVCGEDITADVGGKAPGGERLCLACFEVSERVNFGRPPAKKFVRGPLHRNDGVVDAGRLECLLDGLRLHRSSDACHRFVAFLGWKLEHALDGQRLLYDGTGQFVCVYLSDQTEDLIEDLIVIAEDMLALF